MVFANPTTKNAAGQRYTKESLDTPSKFGYYWPGWVTFTDTTAGLSKAVHRHCINRNHSHCWCVWFGCCCLVL